MSTGTNAGTNTQWLLVRRPQGEADREDFDYMDRYAQVVQKLQDWVLEGRLKYRIDILDGLDRTLEAMSRVCHGRNQGVQLVRIGPEARA